MDEIGELQRQLKETRHLIQFTDVGWKIAHPLCERLNLDTLFSCPISWIGDDLGLRGRFWLNDDSSVGESYRG